MKYVIVICFVLFNYAYTNGQNVDPRIHSKDPKVRAIYFNEQLDKVKYNSEFVFEGTIQKKESYPRIDNDGKDYSAASCIIKITKVLRGELKLGTIELISKIETYGAPISAKRIHGEVGKFDSTFIFFCRSAEKDFPYNPNYNIYQVTNKNILSLTDDYFEDCMIRLPGGNRMFGNSVRSKIDIYNKLKTLPKINISAITTEDTTEQIDHNLKDAQTFKFTKAQIDSNRQVRALKKNQ
jgi:hypothetical protein